MGPNVGPDPLVPCLGSVGSMGPSLYVVHTEYIAIPDLGPVVWSIGSSVHNGFYTYIYIYIYI